MKMIKINKKYFLGLILIIILIPFIPSSIDGCYYSPIKCLCKSFHFLRFHNGGLIYYGTEHESAQLWGHYSQVSKIKSIIATLKNDEDVHIGSAYPFIFFTILISDKGFDVLWRTWRDDEMNKVIIKNLVVQLEFINGDAYKVEYDSEMTEVKRIKINKHKIN